MALLPPEDEDVLILDQHTDDMNRVQYTKTIGIMKQSQNEDGKFTFEWIVTDPSVKELVKNAKHPEKLFKYSPEFKAMNKTEKHNQGEYGQLKHIAITNLANDDDAITTKIYSMVKNAVDKVLMKNATVTLNSKCAASGLIKAGKINRSSPWSFSSQDRQREPISSFLGIDTSQPQDSPQRKKYPVIKKGMVYLSGLRAAASRGGQNAPAIGAKASKLYEEAKNKGDKMEKNEIEEMVTSEIQPVMDRLQEVEKLKEAFQDVDLEKIKETLDALQKLDSIEGLATKIEDIEKNMEKITKGEKEERETLIKNIKVNGGLPEEDVEKMSIDTLRALNEKFEKNSQGAGEGGEGQKKTIVDEINEKYGTNIGESLKGDS